MLEAKDQKSIDVVFPFLAPILDACVEDSNSLL